ncbi:MAG: GyrI-like domain-containing protein [bacterium]|nr:MAG: GyrI-like domain-containing protein [bacterium]
MLDPTAPVSLKDVPALTVASVSSTGPFEEVSRVFMELFRWVLFKGGKVASYPMALFPSPPGDVPSEGVRFEACIPVDPSAGVKPSEGVGVRQLEAVTVASARHHGSLADVGRTYDLILRWMGENGYEAAGPSRELYLTNPLQTPEEDLVTEVQMPVK